MNIIQIERNHVIPIKRQIYQNIRDQILNGDLVARQVLPSTRELAQTLKVSRNTVSEAYEMLMVEGFVLHRQGAPTRVVEGLCLGAYSAKKNRVYSTGKCKV